MITVATKTCPKTGLDIPACSACGQTLSSETRGEISESEMDQVANRWTIHVIEKHPEEALRILADRNP